MPRILEGGKEQVITDRQSDKLRDEKVIYYCGTCYSFHIQPTKSWKDVDRVIGRH